MAGGRVKVFLVVEFEPLRIGLESAIQSRRELSVAGVAPRLEEAVRSPALSAVDLLLVDVDSMNRAETDSTFVAIADSFPRLKVLFLGEIQEAMEIPFETLPVLLRLDTFGFIHKAGPVDRLLDAIKLVCTRGFVCESDAIKHVLSRLSLWATQTSNGLLEHLSEREIEVLSRLAMGKSNKEIARELFVAEGTVKAHVSHIMSKLHVERRAELVKHALASGLIANFEE